MDSGRIQILADQDFPRLKYIAGLILGDILGLSWEIVTESEALEPGPVIRYTSRPHPGSIGIPQHKVISESGISENQILVRPWHNLPAFFVDYGSWDIPFDIFAASFFVVSRYEEYLPFKPDIHGRFRASSSVAFCNGFLDIPVVDFWAIEFGKMLVEKFPSLQVKKTAFSSLLTIDTDQPFEYHGKSVFRSAGGFLRDLFSANGKSRERLYTILGKRSDPFFVYDYILDSARMYDAKSVFFFLLGDHSRHDPNPSWKNKKYRELISRISEEYPVGIHPSYYSFRKYSKVEEEIRRLKAITGGKVEKSRFHFIRFSMPGSLRCLISSGIGEDYSMGYPDEPGFRAGIARPFYLYDLLADQETSLRIIPFMVMDVTLYQYKKLGPGEAGEVIANLIEKVRSAGGMFVSLWHNNSLREDPWWAGWRQVFESMLKLQQP